MAEKLERFLDTAQKQVLNLWIKNKKILREKRLIQKMIKTFNIMLEAAETNLFHGWISQYMNICTIFQHIHSFSYLKCISFCPVLGKWMAEMANMTYTGQGTIETSTNRKSQQKVQKKHIFKKH